MQDSIRKVHRSQRGGICKGKGGYAAVIYVVLFVLGPLKVQKEPRNEDTGHPAHNRSIWVGGR